MLGEALPTILPEDFFLLIAFLYFGGHLRKRYGNKRTTALDQLSRRLVKPYMALAKTPSGNEVFPCLLANT